MRLWIVFILYAVLVIALKSAWRLPGDWLLIAVIYLGFYEDRRTGFPLTLFLGFLLDVVSAGPLGLSMVSFSAVYGMICFFRRKILIESGTSRFLWVFLFAFTGGLISLLFLDYARRSVDYLKIFFPGLLLASFGNGILGIFLLPFFKWYRNLGWRHFFRSRDVLLKK